MTGPLLLRVAVAIVLSNRVASVPGATPADRRLPRGVAPADRRLYTRSDGFVCRADSEQAAAAVGKKNASVSGSDTAIHTPRVLPHSAVNDDFCDCPEDGSDEPGTSACAKGHFFCVNAGSIPQVLSSAMVNDGICDCCDGSDEWLADLQGEPESAQCEYKCDQEMNKLVPLLVGHLTRERQGEDWSMVAKEEFLNKSVWQKTELTELQAEQKSLRASIAEVDKAYTKQLKDVKKDQADVKAGKAVSFARVPNGTEVVLLQCAYTPAAREKVGNAWWELYVNASCLKAEVCNYVCAMLCEGAKTFAGKCTVMDPVDNTTGHTFKYQADGRTREREYNERIGRAGESYIEQIALPHLVPHAEMLASEARLQRTKQRYLRSATTQHSVNQQITQLSRNLQWSDRLDDIGKTVYRSLVGQCLNASKDQYVGTTATREQWHTFHYDLCFFDKITQYEIKVVDEADAFDEAGHRVEVAQDTSEPTKQYLGAPVGFLSPGLFEKLDMKKLAIEQPPFIKPSEHTFLFAEGGECPRKQKRAVAVQFSCGMEVEVRHTAEVRQCAYVLDVSHPGPCDLEPWPATLRDLARNTDLSDLDELSNGVRTWLISMAASSIVKVDEGPIHLVGLFASAHATREFIMKDIVQKPSLLPLITVAGAWKNLQKTGLLARDSSMRLLGAIWRDVSREFSASVDDLLASNQVQEARASVERSVENARAAVAQALEPYSEHYKQLEVQYQQVQVQLEAQYKQAQDNFEAHYKEVQNRLQDPELLQLIPDPAAHIAQAKASLRRLAAESPAVQQVAAYLSEQAMSFEAQRPVGRIRSVPTDPVDVAFLGIYLIAAHLLLLSLLGWLLGCARELLSCCGSCLCCCLSYCCCCCCCCCSRRRVKTSRLDGSEYPRGHVIVRTGSFPDGALQELVGDHSSPPDFVGSPRRLPQSGDVVAAKPVDEIHQQHASGNFDSFEQSNERGVAAEGNAAHNIIQNPETSSASPNDARKQSIEVSENPPEDELSAAGGVAGDAPDEQETFGVPRHPAESDATTAGRVVDEFAKRPEQLMEDGSGSLEHLAEQLVGVQPDLSGSGVVVEGNMGEQSVSTPNMCPESGLAMAGTVPDEAFEETDDHREATGEDAMEQPAVVPACPADSGLSAPAPAAEQRPGVWEDSSHKDEAVAGSLAEEVPEEQADDQSNCLVA